MNIDKFAEEKKEDREPLSSVHDDKTKAVMSLDERPSESPMIIATSHKIKAPSASRSGLQFVGTLIRLLMIEFPLTLLFAALVAAISLHQVHDKYLAPQLKLMTFQAVGRPFLENGYYHRYCTGDEVSATSVSQLLIPTNFTGEECAKHQMIHGVSVYRDLLTPQTVRELREYIVDQNQKQEGWFVIENEFRYSWGIDINMHPAFKKYWKELASNRVLVDALQEIVGPDPAIIEFTAITSAYGAKDQHDHQDVVPSASGAKFAHTFVPSYSLFIPLQDTSYNMGATHVCPGSHLCSEGADENCFEHNLAMSGDDDLWPTGWGALVNQQTTHKGMGHSKKGGLDRVVIIATFAPRPQTFRQLETRMLAQGGSYSMEWSQWGHTFSDFVHADERMWEPLKTMRSLGLWRAKGWNWVAVTSMRIANDDNGYNNPDALDRFIEKGGLRYLPSSWQGEIEEDSNEELVTDNVWYLFFIGTMKRTERGLTMLYKIALPACLIIYLLLDVMRSLWSRRWVGHSSYLARGGFRLLMLHGIVVGLAFWGMKTIDESNWAKDISAGKLYRLPVPPVVVDQNGRYGTRAVLPTETDVLIAPHYASDYLAAYGTVIDLAHPGNAKWNELMNAYAEGYMILPAKLQKEFCQFLLDYMHQEARFLKQGEEREWLPILDTEELLSLCHKDLVAASDKRIATMVRQLNSLKTDTKHGRFRNTALQRKVIPQLLERWDSVLVPQQSWSGQHPIKSPLPWLTVRKNKLVQNVTDTRVSTSRSFKSRYTLPKSREPEEPFPLAWIREGDVVEALYRCESKFYYRGTVLAIIASDSTFHVAFDDGDVNDRLDRSCLRPWQPLRVGEQVQVRTSQLESLWIDGVVVAIHTNVNQWVLFDVQTKDGLMAGITTANIRREMTFQPGDKVSVLDEEDEEWYQATILRADSDGKYFVRYRDGEIEGGVTARRMER